MVIPPLDLGDRLLWVDGMISVNPEQLSQFIFKLAGTDQLKKLAVTKITPEVLEYNQFSDIKINVKTQIAENLFPLGWSIPDHYKYMNIDEYLIGLVSNVEQDNLYDKRIERLSYEIYLFKKLELDDVLKMLIYVIDRLKETKSVWGVGRGSSCSSYLLFLLGLHEVDPVLYEIDIHDFIREGN